MIERFRFTPPMERDWIESVRACSARMKLAEREKQGEQEESLVEVRPQIRDVERASMIFDEQDNSSTRKSDQWRSAAREIFRSTTPCDGTSV